jgi:hypothetical protein
MTHPRELIKRLGIAGVLVALVFLVRLLYQTSGPARSHWIYFTGAYLVLTAFAAYQVLRTVALVAVSRKTSSSLLQALHLRGVRGTLWEIYRRRLTPPLRLPLTLAAWALLIGATVWILWRTASLEALQARVIGNPGRGNDSTGFPICRVLALETPDNNLTRYYRALTALARDFHLAGARILIAEQSPYDSPHSPWWSLVDSLRLSGMLFYESGEGRPQSLPLPTEAPADWRRARFLDQARFLPEENPTVIAFRPVPSWYDGLQINAALQAVAQLRGERTVQQPFYLDGAVRYGDLRIPVTHEGEAFAPIDGRAAKAFVAAAILKEGNDTLFYMDDARPELTSSMSPSLISRVRGQIVLVKWTDAGGFVGPWKNRRPSSVPSIIEALQRGRLITPARTWHHAITFVVLLLGIGLSLGKHLRVASGVMALMALVILGADMWLFGSQMLMTDLIYPALAALLAGIILPLATHFHRHP